jgi:hypothetical protein
MAALRRPLMLPDCRPDPPMLMIRPNPVGYVWFHALGAAKVADDRY